MRKKIVSLGIMGCLVLFVSVDAQAQAPTKRTGQDATYKDPGTATLYAVLAPGVGHLYSGEKRKGLTLMLIGYGGLIGGSLGSTLTCLRATGCSYTPMILGGVALLGAWGYGIYDAGNAARRTNARNGLTASIRPTVVPVSRASLRPGLALQVRW